MKNQLATPFLTIVLLIVTVCPAIAQRWNVSTVWVGKKTVSDPSNPAVMMDVDWATDGSNINIANESVTRGTRTVKSNGTVTFTYTWDAQGTGQPAPPEVYLVEAGTASASASSLSMNIPVQVYKPSYTASTTLDVPNVTTTRNPVTPPQYPTGQQETKSQSQVSWEKISSSGGTFTKQFTIGGEAGVNFNGNNGLVTFAVSLGCSVSIHATPYNLRRDNGDISEYQGYDLYFLYRYDSTTGNIADLTSCRQHERVTYGAGNPYYPPAPFSFSFQNPTIAPAPSSPQSLMTYGYFTDNHSQTPTSALSLYVSSVSFTATQRYEYDDSLTGETDILIPSSTGVNFNYIIRTCEQRAIVPDDPLHNGWWWTSVSKHGFTNWKPVSQ